MSASATGMAAQQQNLDVIADNLANADVAGFKSAQATFAAIGAELGTASSGSHNVLTQGKLMKSGGPFDVGIDGAGFFQIERDGVRGYTRAGAFSRAADGTLRNADGWTLRGIHVRSEAASVAVGADGRVTATLENGTRQAAGRIRLAAFDAPEHLRSLGSAIFGATPSAGTPREISAGGDRQPKIAFGMLERSNVSIVESMMAILAAQRAYEANSKGVQAADEMQRIANNIHRS
ncbi:MAG: flagellar hook-basal body complex protein [Candidatus Eremiobacteraeota bacterium]|nr:flagellar hook-basal body complex protein [Candidatus Eremiobacteraeota bacterium]